MKFALSHIAAAAGLAVVATSALAAPTGVSRPLSNYTSGTTDVYLAGSSAVDLALTKLFDKACDPGTLDTYRSDAGVKTYYLWTCESTTANGFGLASGNTKIAIHKNTNSSSDGVNLLSNATGATVLYLKTADLASCNVAATAIPSSAGLPAYTQSTCGTAAGAAGAGTDPQQPDFGFADSEPSQFNASVAPTLTTAYPFGIVFGVVVSKNVRDALQIQQFGTSGDAAAVPSLSSAQINAIYTGADTLWSQAIGTATTGVFSENPVYVVRRGDGSGSNRAFNTAFVGEFCTPGLPPMVKSTPTANTNVVNPVTECVSSTTSRRKQAATSDDMAACVAQFNSANIGAIGYLSTDYQPQGTDGYRFIKVDGYLPTQLNVVDGKYKVWSEEALTYNTARGIPGDLASFYGRLQAASTDAAYLSAVSQGLTQPIGGWTGGLLGAQPNNQNQTNTWGLAVAGSLPVVRTNASVLANPANPLSRALSTGYNLCAQPTPARGYQAQ
ncbi:MAG: substrate-binding domain-containing protein [Betaproteobacteria bacterium]